MSARTPVHSDDAPAAIGPYSQAVSAGGLLFCSGQVALPAQGGGLVGGGDVGAQTEQVMKNLEAVLTAGGCAFSDVVKTTIYLVDLGDFKTVGDIYARAFEGSTPPARATIQVAALPKGALVEIDAVAVIPS